MPRSTKNLLGMKFGDLLVVDYAEPYLRKTKTGVVRSRATAWTCECACGKIRVVQATNLIAKASTSCGGCCKRRNNTPREAALRDRYRNYRLRAKTRGMLFAMSFPEFLELTKCDCFYCGASPNNAARPQWLGEKPEMYSGIDRRDNSLGYVGGNIVPCCKPCNFAKSNLTETQFIELCKRVAGRFA